MRFGYCLDIKFLDGDKTSRTIFDAVAQAGFDYVELPLSALAQLPVDRVLNLKHELEVIPCRACNLFFTPDITIVGSQMNIPAIRAYLERMLPLVADLGVENLVFGNGSARNVPDGFNRDFILENLRTLVEIMNEYANYTGITIAVEPLNLTETNIINCYSSAVRLTEGLSHVSAMIDSYHVAMDKQNYDDVYKNPEALKHLHIAYPIGRMVPSHSDDIYLYTQFRNMVADVDYNNKISIEGRLRAKEPDGIGKEIKSCLALLNKLWR